ncbi:MAG TPA: proline--tRNA ligase [Polyangia bacterium]|jgi:prolyl-tRNA synthetase|nr:proline--tRNA ligase [Polyangia bacterium]
MRYSQFLAPTLKEAPAEAQVVSHVLLIRGGYIRKVAAGIYSLLPLGMRVVHKIERIVREELDAIGAQEVLLPMVHPAELWQESGRWQLYGPELGRFEDRKGAHFALSPTAEEAIVDLVRRDVRSYRQLPVSLYQIQDKFRDEIRPRAGLMRGREFIMKDAYSFHADAPDAHRTYRDYYGAYSRIFRRCGLEFRAVEADTGAIGGSLSHEFQVLAESGEDAIVSCDRCDYAANVEKAELKPQAGGRAGERSAARALEEVHTPGKGSIADVAAFLKEPLERFVKTLIVVADGKLVAALVRGDRDINLLKLKAALGAQVIDLATDAAVTELTGAPVGFAGPQGLKAPVYADPEVATIEDGVTGANKKDYHVRGFHLGRDVPGAKILDLRTAAAGDACARCEGGHYRAYRGIEVGHVFFLGTKYSEPMKCNFLDAEGKERPMVMGCYGIGITRIMAAAIEQNHDEGGIVWPMPIAPFQVEVVAAGQEPEVVKVAGELHDELVRAGVEVLYDDRDERPGPKFKDADLLGIPLRVTVGKKALAERVVEVKDRRGGAMEKVPMAEAARVVQERVAGALAAATASARGSGAA